MLALKRAIRKIRRGEDRVTNIFSDSKLALQVLVAPKTYNLLVHSARKDIMDIDVEGKKVRLFWVGTNAGTTENEREDELARNAIRTKKTKADYDRCPLIHAKRVIRAVNLKEWQERYTEGNTGEVTKCFFRRVETGYKVLRQIEMMPTLAWALTGHGMLAQYLNRFKIKNSPNCPRDSIKTQDTLHALEDCDIFLKERADVEEKLRVE